MGASVFFLDNLNKNISPQKGCPDWAKRRKNVRERRYRKNNSAKGSVFND